MVNLSAYLLFRHIQYVSWLVIVELGENVKEETKLAVSENYVNIRYGNSQIIEDALAYIYDYVSAVTLLQIVVDIAVQVVSRHTLIDRVGLYMQG